MSQQEAREFFALHAQSKKLSKALQAADPSKPLAWEHVSVSELSPGIVEDNETLIRQVLLPQHIDEASGELHPNFFEDVADKGGSSHRLKHLDLDGIYAIAKKRVETINSNPPKTGPRSLLGVTSVIVSEVRAIEVVDESGSGTRRGLAVYDTSNADDASHADICQIVPGKQARQSVIARLWRLAKDRLTRHDDRASESQTESPDGPAPA